MKKITYILGLYVALYLIPVITLAQESSVNALGPVDDFFNNINTFIGNTLIPLVFGLALLMFIWGMFKFFILGGGNEEDRGKGKQLIIWSIVAFVLMTSIWGIVNMLAGGIFPNQEPPNLPSSLTR